MPTKSGEVVVITGASAGVGRATARAFAEQGARVALLARGKDGLEAARREVEQIGGRALIIPCEVSDASNVEAAAEKVERRFGPIDVWVNNAMVSVFSEFAEMTAQEFKRVTEVTYLGYVYGTMAALKRMLPRDKGTIVQVGSALAYRSIPLQSAYCGAKHAIVGFTDSIRCELIHRRSRIHMTVVHMPALNTPQFSWAKSRLPRNPQPVPPIYQPEVAADAIVWAAHHRRRELWVGGSTTVALLAQKFAPEAADWYLGKTGYRSQQTREPVSRDRRDNLWEPVPGDHGAHGSFDSRATDDSIGLWLSKNKGWLKLGGIALGALALYSYAKHGLATVDDVLPGTIYGDVPVAASVSGQPGSNDLEDQRVSERPIKTG